MFTLIKDS